MYFKKLFLVTMLCLFSSLAWSQKCIEGDCVNGFGTYTFAYGDKYVGEWQNGKQHGQGIFTFTSGAKYDGEYQDGKRHGRGAETYASGAKYVGEFQYDKRHGKGTFTDPNGEAMSGIFKKNSYLGIEAEIKEKAERELMAKKQKCIRYGFEDKTDGMGVCLIELDKLDILKQESINNQQRAERMLQAEVNEEAIEQRKREQNQKESNFLLNLSQMLLSSGSSSSQGVQGYFRDDVVSGTNRICYYKVNGGIKVLNIRSVDICPITQKF